MPEFTITTKFWALKSRWEIFDQNGVKRFSAIRNSTLFSTHLKISVIDEQNKRVAEIVQKSALSDRSYTVEIAGAGVGYIQRKFGFLRNRFEFYSSDLADFVVEGNYFRRNFTFSSGERLIAVCKRRPAFGDSYRIDIVEGENYMAIFCMILVLNFWFHRNSAA
ncbi:MAG: hypothetical protein ACK5NT_15020 [Pyrinomonadaceae bacterium]